MTNTSLKCRSFGQPQISKTFPASNPCMMTNRTSISMFCSCIAISCAPNEQLATKIVRLEAGWGMVSQDVHPHLSWDILGYLGMVDSQQSKQPWVLQGASYSQFTARKAKRAFLHVPPIALFCINKGNDLIISDYIAWICYHILAKWWSCSLLSNIINIYQYCSYIPTERSKIKAMFHRLSWADVPISRPQWRPSHVRQSCATSTAHQNDLRREDGEDTHGMAIISWGCERSIGTGGDPIH